MQIVVIIDDEINETVIHSTIEKVYLIDKTESKNQKRQHKNNSLDVIYEKDYGHATKIANIIESSINKKIMFLNIVILDSMMNGNVYKLKEAFELIINRNLRHAIINLSIGTECLSDDNLLKDYVYEIQKTNLFVSAISNDVNVTLPAYYPGVIGVRQKKVDSLQNVKMFYVGNDVLGTQIIVNYYNTEFSKHGIIPSNSFAVPIVIAEIIRNITTEISYEKVITYFKNTYPCNADVMRIEEKSRNRPIIINFYFCTDNKDKKISFLLGLINYFSTYYSVQAILLTDIYDVKDNIRIVKISNDENKNLDIDDIVKYYKIDLVFLAMRNDRDYKKNLDIKITKGILETGDKENLMKLSQKILRMIEKL